MIPPSDPADSPRIVIYLNKDWRKYLLGLVESDEHRATSETDKQQIEKLQDVIGTAPDE